MSSNAFLNPIESRPVCAGLHRLGQVYLSNPPLVMQLRGTGQWRACWNDGGQYDVKLTLSWVSPGGRWAGLLFESERGPALRVLLSAKNTRASHWRRLLVRLRYPR